MGQKIKSLRKQKKYTLKEVAEKTSVSISFLSQLENGKTSATLESLKKISETLDVTPSYFFPQDQQVSTPTIMRHDTHQIDLQESSFVYKNLAGQVPDALFSPLLIIMQPGDNRGELFSHAGEEFLYVLKGTLTVLLKNEKYTLSVSDSIYIDSTMPHYWENNTDEEIQFLCIAASGDAAEIREKKGF